MLYKGGGRTKKLSELVTNGHRACPIHAILAEPKEGRGGQRRGVVGIIFGKSRRRGRDMRAKEKVKLCKESGSNELGSGGGIKQALVERGGVRINFNKQLKPKKSKGKGEAALIGVGRLRHKAGVVRKEDTEAGGPKCHMIKRPGSRIKSWNTREIPAS